MNLSAKTRYALLALSEFQDREERLSLKEISQRQKLPLKYLERIFKTLDDHGLVEGKRGPNGGYRLTRDPSRISLKEVILSLEEEIRLFRCLKKPRSDDPDWGGCFSPIWDNLNGMILDYLDSLTLKDLSTKEDKRERESEVG